MPSLEQKKYNKRLPNYYDMLMWIKLKNELNSGEVTQKIIQKNINTSE